MEVRIKNYESYPQYEGQIGTVVNKKHNNPYKDTCVTVVMPYGRIINPYTPLALSPQCEYITQPYFIY